MNDLETPHFFAVIIRKKDLLSFHIYDIKIV